MLRAILISAAALPTLIITACGGGGSGGPQPTYTIGGTVSGLTAGNSIDLADNGTDTLTISGNGSFTFQSAIASGGSYAVTVNTQPTGQTCSVSNGTESHITTNVTDVSVTCSTNYYSIGGTLSGLNSGQLVLLYDNGGDALTLKANGAFTFPTRIAYKSNYSVTVSAQPTDQFCTVANGTGSVSTSAISNVNIACVTNQSVGGVWKSSYVVQSGLLAGTVDNSFALVTESGQFFVFDENATTLCAGLTFGMLTERGASVIGSGNQVLITYAPGTTINTSCVYPDGTTSATGTLTGAVVQQKSLILTTQGVTSAGLSLASATTSWIFDAAYLQAASVASVVGTYDDNGQSFTITDNGTQGFIYETDPNGCLISGSIFPFNTDFPSYPNYNMYYIDLAFDGCTGYPASAFNG